MRTYSTTLMVLLTATVIATTVAQIPNSGFENWINAGTHLNPEGWWTPNDSIQSGDFYPITRSDDHYPESIGNYSMRLENNPALYPDWASVGVAWTGEFRGNDNPVFPVIGHPTSLWGYFKFFPENGDTMEMHIRLYKDGVDGSGGSFKTAETVTDWTPFSITLSEYTDADSARIFLSSCYDNDEPIPHGNSVLYLDNLSFDQLITGVASDAYREVDITVYPNPAGEAVTITIGSSLSGPVYFSLYDAFGRRLLNKTTAGKAETTMLDISALPEGMYFLCATTGRRRIYDEKILIVH